MMLKRLSLMIFIFLMGSLMEFDSKIIKIYLFIIFVI